MDASPSILGKYTGMLAFFRGMVAGSFCYHRTTLISITSLTSDVLHDPSSIVVAWYYAKQTDAPRNAIDMSKELRRVKVGHLTS